MDKTTRLDVRSYGKRDSVKSVFVHNYKGDLFDGRVRVKQSNDFITFTRVGLDDKNSHKLTKDGHRYYTNFTWPDAEFGIYEYLDDESDEDMAIFSLILN